VLKIVYAGSPDISALLLKGLIDSEGVNIAAVLTSAPAPAGRSKTPQQTATAALAREHGLCVLEPEKLDAQIRTRIAELHADLLVCFAYGKIFGPKFLALFPKGGINLHPSLLPKYRGCAPVPAAILAGDSETGITVQRLAQEMDSGDILAQQTIPLNGTETAPELLRHAASLSIPLVCKVLSQIESGTETPKAQNHTQASYCRAFKKEDARMDWTQSARHLCAQVRALQGWPGTYTNASGAKLYIHQARVYECKGAQTDSEKKEPPGTVIGVDKTHGILIQTGEGVLAVQILQREAKKAMQWKDFLNGCRDFCGTRCTNGA